MHRPALTCSLPLVAGRMRAYSTASKQPLSMVPEGYDDHGIFIDLLPSEVQLGGYVAIDNGVVIAGQLSGDKVLNNALGVAGEMSDKEDLRDAILPAGRTAKAAANAFAVFGRIPL